MMELRGHSWRDRLQKVRRKYAPVIYLAVLFLIVLITYLLLPPREYDNMAGPLYVPAKGLVVTEANPQYEWPELFWNSEPSVKTSLMTALDEIQMAIREDRLDLYNATMAYKEIANVLADLPKNCKTQSRIRKNPENIAICIYGSFRVNPVTVRSFRRFVYVHLGEPDVFMYVKPLNYEGAEALQKDFLTMVKKYEIVEDVDYTVIKAKGQYSKCLDETKEHWNWNHGWPGQTKGSVVHQYRGAEQCGRMIRESEQKRKKKYDRIILTRSDHMYVGAHPRMRLLNPEYSYVPLGEDYEGINDRHSIYTRKDAEVRFGIHESLMSGKLDCSIVPLWRVMNAETFLEHIYRIHHVEMKRFYSSNYLGCTENLPRYCPKNETYRYPSEYRTAHQNKISYGLFWAVEELLGHVERERERCNY